jgi:asparagine synthetase B (glutamine-hydrolysing)
MCGIAGVGNRANTPPRELIDRRCVMMRHRGSDEEGIPDIALPGAHVHAA